MAKSIKRKVIEGATNDVVKRMRGKSAITRAPKPMPTNDELDKKIDFVAGNHAKFINKCNTRLDQMRNERDELQKAHAERIKTFEGRIDAMAKIVDIHGVSNKRLTLQGEASDIISARTKELDARVAQLEQQARRDDVSRTVFNDRINELEKQKNEVNSKFEGFVAHFKGVFQRLGDLEAKQDTEARFPAPTHVSRDTYNELKRRFDALQKDLQGASAENERLKTRLVAIRSAWLPTENGK